MQGNHLLHLYCAWGADLVQFFAAQAVLLRSVWKKWLNSSYSFKSTEAKQLARQGNEQNLPPKTDATTFAFASLSILLLCLKSTVTEIFIEFWACALHILCFLLFTAKGFEYIICTVLTVWSVGPQAILWGGPPDRISNPGWAVQRQGHLPIYRPCTTPPTYFIPSINSRIYPVYAVFYLYLQ